LGRDDANTLLVSGNIEAHESVLSFKTVQSRLVELPLDEGQWVKAGLGVGAQSASISRLRKSLD
jgi:HlyD family secretion protein